MAALWFQIAAGEGPPGAMAARRIPCNPGPRRDLLLTTLTKELRRVPFLAWGQINRELSAFAELALDSDDELIAKVNASY